MLTHKIKHPKIQLGSEIRTSWFQGEETSLSPHGRKELIGHSLLSLSAGSLSCLGVGVGAGVGRES